MNISDDHLGAQLNDILLLFDYSADLIQVKYICISTDGAGGINLGEPLFSSGLGEGLRSSARPDLVLPRPAQQPGDADPPSNATTANG
jgi:hypothetical protein